MDNYHVLIVHFPVALLTTYAFLEMARLKKLIAQPWFFYVKAVFVIIGTLASYAAIIAGEMIEGSFAGTGSERFIEMHSRFGIFTSCLFSVIAASYAIAWLNRDSLLHIQNPTLLKVWGVLTKIQSFIFQKWILIPLAAIGALSVFITGSLGGGIAFGPDVDPFVKIVYSILFPGN